MDILKAINQVEWCDYATAYGNAGRTDIEYANIPLNLQQLFSSDKEQAKEATHNLWCSLCHQHSYVSSAALPAYEILLYGLQVLEDDLKVELLDIFMGFALCINKNCFQDSWQGQLRAKLERNKSLFHTLISNQNEDIAAFAENIYDEL